MGAARGVYSAAALLEARLGKPGTREYVQVLRLLEDFRLGHVRGAIRDALALGVIGFDAVKHLGCAASNTGRPGSIWRSIRICRPHA